MFFEFCVDLIHLILSLDIECFLSSILLFSFKDDFHHYFLHHSNICYNALLYKTANCDSAKELLWLDCGT